MLLAMMGANTTSSHLVMSAHADIQYRKRQPRVKISPGVQVIKN